MSQTSGECPRLEIMDDVARITLDREAQHNRIDPADLVPLRGYLDRIRHDSSIRVLVITGTGTRTFSSGYTLSAIKDELDDRFERFLDEVENLSMPVICALNGSAYGGATDLALCCDIRIGVKGSRMFMPAAKFGLHYYPDGIRRYVTALGLTAAKKLFLTAKPVTADDMLKMNFLTELVDPETLEPTVEDYIESIRACAPGVLRSMKRDLNATAAGTADIELQRASYEASLKSEELAQRVAGI